jgi:hypothetical protein
MHYAPVFNVTVQQASDAEAMRLAKMAEQNLRERVNAVASRQV